MNIDGKTASLVIALFQKLLEKCPKLNNKSIGKAVVDLHQVENS